MIDNLNGKEVEEVKREEGPLSDAKQKEKWSKLYENSLEKAEAKEDSIDLLFRLMQFDPRQRLSAKSGLTHSYCVQFSDPQTETICESNVSMNPRVPDDNEKLCGGPATSPAARAQPHGCSHLRLSPIRSSFLCAAPVSPSRTMKRYRDAIYENIDKKTKDGPSQIKPKLATQAP